jgi:NTP pyrophosphatase (non-canonical NTP hydrolase)
MELKNYQNAAKRTNTDLGSQLSNSMHMLMGLTTEVGELTDVYKRKFAYGKEIDMTNVEEEIGDILWYLVNFCTLNNLDIEKCMGKNISKLYVRFPEKFNQDQALVRDLEKEREILEMN